MYEIPRQKKNTQDFIKKIFNQIRTNTYNLNEFNKDMCNFTLVKNITHQKINDL